MFDDFLGAEACISPLAIAGFCRLRALSTSFNDQPDKASRPFDEKRDGFVMGEGSAILVLEELEHAKKRGAHIIAEILGYGLSGDASHLTSPREDGSGAQLAMSRALCDAEVKLEDMGYITTHATSTPVGDTIEAKAIKTLFNDHVKNLAISSTKGAHGHLLGSAGNLELAFTALSCQHGQIPPTLNVETVHEDLKGLNLVANVAQNWPSAKKRRVALKNSFGFGGTNTSLCIAQYDK
jgi:3-oxoacyl-[acyl-carrier-protein] synthase II